MKIAVGIFAVIGAMVVLAVVLFTFREAIRAARQSLRLAWVHARTRGRRFPKRSWILPLFAREFGSAYSEMVIGPFRVPHDPSLPIRRSFRWPA